jgi:hypothetical protein
VSKFLHELLISEFQTLYDCFFKIVK